MGYGSVVAARGEIAPSMARNGGGDNGSGGGSGGGGGIPDNISSSATEDDRNMGMDEDDYYEEEEEDEDMTLSGSGSDTGGLIIGESGRPPVAPTAAGLVDEKLPGISPTSTRETSGSRVTFQQDDGDSGDGGGSISSGGVVTPRRVGMGCRSASLSPKQPAPVQAPPQVGRLVGGGRGSGGAVCPKVHVPLLGHMSSVDWSAPAESDVDDEDDDEDDSGWGQVVVKPVKVARYDKEQRRWMKTMLSLPELRKIMLTRVEKTPQKVTYRRAATLVRGMKTRG